MRSFHRTCQNLDLIVLHPNLFIGGAETQIINLVTSISEKRRVLLALYDADGPGLEQLSGVKNLEILDLKRRERGYMGVSTRMLKVFRENRDATLYTFLVGQNILGFLLARMARLRRIVWGNRISSFEKGEFGWKGNVAFWIEQQLSRWVPLIISNSWQGEFVHQKRKMRPQASLVIPNGIDVNKYSPKSLYRERFRSEIGVGSTDIVIGLICRIVEWKGVEDFVRAAALVNKNHKNVRFICVGGGETSLIKQYQALAVELGLSDWLIWMGPRDDIEEVLNGIDVLASASTSGEGFPNIIGEAMATGRPVVSTRVGDNARIIGDAGIFISPGCPEALADALQTLIASEELRSRMGRLGLRRITDCYSVSAMVRATDEALFQ